MAKIPALPTLAAPVGNELVVIADPADGHRTKGVAIDQLANAAVAPALERAEDAADRAEHIAAAGYRSVKTYGEREAIPLDQREPGMLVRVLEGSTDGGRVFIWNPSLAMPGAWTGLLNEEEKMRLDLMHGGIGQDKVYGLPDTLTALQGANAALAAVKVGNFRAQLLAGAAARLSWSRDGARPTAQAVTWSGWSVPLRGDVDRFEPRDWSKIERLFVTGNSLSDTTGATDQWSQQLAAALAIPLVSVARGSSDARQIYKTGAAPLVLTLAGALPANGSVGVTRINGVAPSLDSVASPASFLNSYGGDAAPASMTGYVSDGTTSRRVTVSIARSDSTDYRVTQAAGGTAVTFSGPVVFTPDTAIEPARSLVGIWIGNNYFFSGVPNGFGDYTNPGMFADIDAIVRQAAGSRIFILPILPASDWIARGAGTPYDAHVAANVRLRSLYLRYWLLDAQGRDLIAYLQQLGSDGSAGDQDDVAKGFIPRSCRYDPLHLNAKGNGLVKAFVQPALALQALPPALAIGDTVRLTARGGADVDSAVATVQADPAGDAIGKTVKGEIAPQLSTADRMAGLMPQAAGVELIPNGGDLGKLILAFLDQAGFLGAGITADGTLAAGKLRALTSILTPLLGIGKGGTLALDRGAKLAFSGDGKITHPTGTAVSMQGANYDWCITDPNNNVLLGLMKGKLYGPGSVINASDKRITASYSTGVTIDMGAHNYDVCICDPNGNVLLGWMNGVFYSPLGASGAAALDAQDAADKSFTTAVHSRRVTNVSRPTSAYVLQFVYGQSLAQGDETWPALSRVNRFGNLMFGQSVQPLNGGNTYRPVGGATTLQPLAAITIDGSNKLYTDETVEQASGGARGEPVNHGWTNATRFLLAQHLLTEDYASRRFVSVNVAVSGATIGELEKNHTEGGTESYARYTDAVAKVKAIADAEGKGVSVGGLVYMQGEHDYFQASGHNSQNITYAAYRPKLEALIANMQADAVALTGQVLPPPFLMYQTGASYTRDADINGLPGMHIGMAQLDVALASKTAFMVGPVYPYTDKGGHLDSNGSRWFGHQIAKVHHRVAVEGRGWQPLRPIRIWQDGPTTIYVAYHVPHAPLVFDKPQLANGGEYDNAARGFRLTDTNGALAVSDVAIVRDTIVRITTARPIVGTAQVWYASQGTSGNGMVRDSDPSTAIDSYVYEPERGMYATANLARFVGKPYPLWNWSVAFTLPVGFKEQA